MRGAEISKRQCTKNKLKENCNAYNIKTSNSLMKSKVKMFMIKCAYRVNPCRVRIDMIDNQACGSEYLRCSEVET